MEIKVTNQVKEDSFYLSGDSIEEIRKSALEEIARRGWRYEDCYSEKV